MDSQSFHKNIFKPIFENSSTGSPFPSADLCQPAISEQKYNSLLEQWIQQEEKRKNSREESMEIHQVKSNKNKIRKSYGNGNKQNYTAVNANCEICIKEIWNITKANYCRLCHRQFCEQCMGRMRAIIVENKQYWEQKLESQNAPTCLSCDKNYLNSMVEIEFQKQIKPKIEKFNILKQSLKQIKELEIKSNSQQPSLSPKISMKQIHQKITVLQQRNRTLQKQNIEIRRKISWGEEVHKNLKQQLLKHKRRFQKSLSSQSIITQGMGIKPPCPYESETGLSEKNALNDSVIGSIIEEQTQLIDRTKCCSAPCSIM